MGMMEELHLEELSLRMTQEKMDDAFRTAMQRAIDAGEEKTPTVVSKKPGTRNPVVGRRVPALLKSEISYDRAPPVRDAREF